MAGEQTGASEGQESKGTQPQAGNGQGQEPGQQGSQAGSGGSTTGTGDDAARLQAELEETRKEAASYRTKAKRLEDAAKAAEDAKLPEQERTAKRLAELEAKETQYESDRRSWSTEKAVVQAAVRLGFRDPADAFALLDRSAIEYDDKGQPTNVTKLLEKLAESKAYLTGAPRSGSFDQGPRGKAAAGSTMDDLLREATGHRT